MANLLKNDQGALKGLDVVRDVESFEHVYAAASDAKDALGPQLNIVKPQPNAGCSRSKVEVQTKEVEAGGCGWSGGLRDEQLQIDSEMLKGDQENWQWQQLQRQQINNENVKLLDDGGYEELSSEFLCNFSSDDCERFVRYYWDYKSGKLLSRRNNREDVQKV